MELDTKSLTVLRRSGWYPGRKKDPMKLVDYYRTRSMDLNSHAIGFLEEFMDLDLCFELRLPEDDSVEDVSFFVQSTFSSDNRDWYRGTATRARWVREVLNRNIAFVGLFYTWQMDLFIDTEGNHFATNGLTYNLLGHDKYQTINNLVAEKPLFSIRLATDLEYGDWWQAHRT